MKLTLCLSLTLGIFVMLAASGAEETAPALQAKLAQKAEREVRENILPFWLRYAPDRELGGFNGSLKDDLTLEKSAPRGSLLTIRILWAFSAAYRHFHDPAQLEMARRAYDDLVNRFWDDECGGIFWTITAEGKPLDTSKQIYGEVFGIYALSEYYRATSDPTARERAIALYRLVELHAHDSQHGGYFEVFTRDWRRERAAKSPVNSVAAKSQNTHLHVMEAYTNLLRVWSDAGLRANQEALVELMLTRIYDGRSHHLRLFMAEDWTPKSTSISYGHDIEAAWLMTEAAGILGGGDLIRRTQSVAVEIAETTLKEGVDRDGGIFNEGGPGGISDANKDWWQQAEAVVGFLEAYQVSGDRRFLDAAVKTWGFIEKYLVDREGGDWLQSVTKEGVSRHLARMSLWKCPYHNSRACFEIMDRLEPSGAKGKP